MTKERVNEIDDKSKEIIQCENQWKKWNFIEKYRASRIHRKTKISNIGVIIPMEGKENREQDNYLKKIAENFSNLVKDILKYSRSLENSEQHKFKEISARNHWQILPIKEEKLILHNLSPQKKKNTCQIIWVQHYPDTPNQKKTAQKNPYRPIFLKKINAKMLNKVLVIQIQ